MRISDITVAYGPRIIFSNFSQNLDAEKLLLTGPSGCGKTTLLKEIFKQRKFSPKKRGRTVLVLQEDALLPWATAIENILSFCHAYTPRLTVSDIQQHTLYSIICDFSDKPAWTLSFGERRSIELIRAFLSGPQTLLLDEPFNFLDPYRRQVLADYLLGEYSKSREVIITTHEITDFANTGIVHYKFPDSYPVTSLEYKGRM